MFNPLKNQVHLFRICSSVSDPLQCNALGVRRKPVLTTYTASLVCAYIHMYTYTMAGYSYFYLASKEWLRAADKTPFNRAGRAAFTSTTAHSSSRRARQGLSQHEAPAGSSSASSSTQTVCALPTRIKDAAESNS